MNKPRFLLDENVNRAVQRQLRRLDSRIEVLAVGEVGTPPTGATDAEILEWIEQNGFPAADMIVAFCGILWYFMARPPRTTDRRPQTPDYRPPTLQN